MTAMMKTLMEPQKTDATTETSAQPQDIAVQPAPINTTTTTSTTEHVTSGVNSSPMHPSPPVPTPPQPVVTEPLDISPRLTNTYTGSQSGINEAPEQQALRGGSSFDTFLQLIFRVGFASIFLINAVVAALRPEDFLGMLENNIIASRLGYHDLMIKFTMINDLLLGVFLLLGKYKRLVYPWAGAWLITVAGLKLMNLVM